MPRKPKSDLSETIRLRHYVMNVIYRNPGRSIRLPSSRELAATFGVARSTVQLALEKLSAENYLSSRPGVATYTVPRNDLWFQREKQPLIGLVLATGDYFFYDRSAWEMLTHMGMAASDRDCNLRLLDNVTVTPENIEEIIENNYLDALFCGNVFDAGMIRKAAAKIPVVTFGTSPVEGVSSVETDWSAAAKQFYELLRSENRQRVLFLNTADGPLTNLLREMNDGAIDIEHRQCATRDELALLRERLKNDPPQALVCNGCIPEMTAFFSEFGIDPRRDCLLTAYIGHPRRGFRGGSFQLPYSQACKLAAEILHERLFAGETRIRHEACDVTFIPELQETL